MKIATITAAALAGLFATAALTVIAPGQADAAQVLDVLGFGNSYLQYATTGGAPTTVTTTGVPFQYAFGGAADSAGNLYVGEYVGCCAAGGGGDILKVTPGGVSTRYYDPLLQPPFNGARYPLSPSLDSAGNLYFASEFNDSNVYKETPGGTVSVYGSFGGGNSYGTAFDAAGNLYVANAFGGSGSGIWKIPAGGGPATLFAQLADPDCAGCYVGFGGIAFDSSGNLIAVNANHNTVEEFSSAGAHLATLGSGTGLHSLVIDAGNDIFVAEENSNNSGILEIKPGDIVSTFATGLPDFDALIIANVGGSEASDSPEPASLALLGAGLAGLSFARRRKRA